MTQTLTDAIDQLVREKTFNLEALEAIQALKTRAEAQDRDIANKNRTIDRQGLEMKTLSAHIARLEQDVVEFKARETHLAAREAKVQAIELKEAVSTARGDTFEKVFATIFANVKVRELATRQLPFSSNDHGRTYNGFQPATEIFERISE